MNQRVKERFTELLGEGRVLTGEPLDRHTTFRIGGPADYFLLPHTPEEIREILQICAEEGIPFFILGNGSNLLVSDRGFSGAVISLYRNMAHLRVEGTRITASCGALLSAISAAARNSSLTGLEFAGGIPGTLGGAVVMNAGAYGSEMKDVLTRVKVMTRQGEILYLTPEELEMGYRTSLVKKEGYLVLEAEMELQEGDPDEIRSLMRELMERRTSRQPLEFPSAGSTFKRPAGYFAGKLIMDSGLAGYQVGGARVSEKHCGFVINTGNATAADVFHLMEMVSERVWEKFGVTLEPEVQFLGDFS